MTGIFSKFKSGSGPASPGAGSGGHKKPELEKELTPLEKMLLNAGPVRPDGSDKFFGMENFGNTCYCNSIVQALYYSAPFREHVVKYPPHSPHDTPNGNPVKAAPIRAMNGGATSPQKAKGLTAQEAIARRKAAAAAAPPPSTQPGQQRPEDKPDSPEYKKKHAILAGPILDLTYENASSYSMEESTFTALKDIFMALIANPSRIGVLSPQRFLEIFKRDNEMFRTSMHQDAHEFYGLVLNAVITNVEDNSKRMKELEPPKNDNGLERSVVNAVSHAANSMGLASGMRSPGTGWVHEIFEGVLTSETKCLTCETASQRDETFLDLSIDLEEHSSVTSCLRKFSAEEMLCERNKFHCDNCGGLQEAEKRMKIKRLPKILTLHLKRFKYTEDMTRLQKLFHRVVYPYHLRMFNTTDDAEDPDRLYELYAVVVHIGGNAYHGHYVSIIKTQDRGWLLFDDEMVEPVDKHYVRNFFGDKPGMACAYVLFYQETTLEAVQREQEAEGLAEVALATQEAGISLGNPQPNGTHPSAISKQVTVSGVPVREFETLPSLNHAVTSPAATTSPSAPSSDETAFMPKVSILTSGRKPDSKHAKESKGEKERVKREIKEAEKARRAAEKEKTKLEEQRRRDFDTRRKEMLLKQQEDMKAALAASKATAAEDDEKRKLAGLPVAGEKEKKENGIMGGLGGLSLKRDGKGSKSMSRKSLGWLKKEREDKDKDKASSEASGEAQEDVPPPLPDKPLFMPVRAATDGKDREKEKAAKERFSFGLGRKKSNILGSG